MRWREHVDSWWNTYKIVVTEAEEKKFNHRWEMILMYIRFVVKERAGFYPLMSGSIGRHLWTQWCCKCRDFQ
jgi:hypothetical protein